MRIEVSDEGGLVIRELYSGVMFETDSGQRLSVAMRDGGFEIGLFAGDEGPRWVTIDNGVIIGLGKNELKCPYCHQPMEGQGPNVICRNELCVQCGSTKARDFVAEAQINQK